jgi:hypothetical protein
MRLGVLARLKGSDVSEFLAVSTKSQPGGREGTLMASWPGYGSQASDTRHPAVCRNLALTFGHEVV